MLPQLVAENLFATEPRVSSSLLCRVRGPSFHFLQPAHSLPINQAQIGLIDERSSLQVMAGSLSTQAPFGQPAQFSVDQWG
jgi:hypothetical protein